MGKFFGDMLSDFLGDIRSIFVFAVFLAILYAIGQVGYLLRRGVETKKGLRQAKEQAREKGYSFNQNKYDELNGKATQMIVFPILGLILFYILLYVVLPGDLFFWSFLLIIAPVLGYFGKYVAPDVDTD